MVFAREGHRTFFEHSRSLTVDRVRTVDQNVADGRIPQQHLERPESEGLVENFRDQQIALNRTQQQVIPETEDLGRPADFLPQLGIAATAQRGQVQSADQTGVQLAPSRFVQPPGSCGPLLLSPRQIHSGGSERWDMLHRHPGWASGKSVHLGKNGVGPFLWSTSRDSGAHRCPPVESFEGNAQHTSTRRSQGVGTEGTATFGAF